MFFMRFLLFYWEKCRKFAPKSPFSSIFMRKGGVLESKKNTHYYNINTE